MKRFFFFLAAVASVLTLSGQVVKIYDAGKLCCQYVNADSVVFVDTLSDQSCLSKGFFSVSDSTQVQFAIGNLLYEDLTNRWYISDDPFLHWDVIYNSCDCDLFYWCSKETWYGLSKNYNCVQAVDFGSLVGNNWRTLSLEEWDYLMKSRPGASRLFGYAKVENQYGLIILPDGFVDIAGIPFLTGDQISMKVGGSGLYTVTYYVKNKYTAAEWNQLAESGAVFLPSRNYYQSAGGTRCEGARYWSSSHQIKSSGKMEVALFSFLISTQNVIRTGNGCGYYQQRDDPTIDINNAWYVRLVKDVQ